MEEQIKQALEVGKSLAKAMIEDKEMASLSAKVSKVYLNSYIEAGFTREEAVQLVVAMAGKIQINKYQEVLPDMVEQ